MDSTKVFIYFLSNKNLYVSFIQVKEHRATTRNLAKNTNRTKVSLFLGFCRIRPVRLYTDRIFDFSLVRYPTYSANLRDFVRPNILCHDGYLGL